MLFFTVGSLFSSAMSVFVRLLFSLTSVLVVVVGEEDDLSVNHNGIIVSHSYEVSSLPE